MTEQTDDKISGLLSLAKPIFLKWEKLRIPYNAILLVAFVLAYATPLPVSHSPLFHPVFLLYLLACAVLANLCFFAAPVVETYAAWLGIRPPILTAILFVGGVLISIPLVVIYGNPLFLMKIGVW